MLTYELSIWLGHDENSWEVAYRFEDHPDLATLTYLKEEAAKVFDGLYDMTPSECCISLVYLDKKDREDPRLVTLKE